ncbi:unnamed protein product [Dovyalis caffra]|uniref:Sugar phosphate transporter domain-containing protein n=1 Tax=Dovyalis caffra TaxID=77055 RepID=A0AAV1RCX3_9ROSI|nr:unnamed protein product [Dovyalis caffra]
MSTLLSSLLQPFLFPISSDPRYQNRYQACGMSDFKLDVVIAQDFPEPDFRPKKEETISGAEKINDAVYKIFSGNFAGRRAISDRLFRGNQADSDSLGNPNGGEEKREHGSGKKSGPLLSGTAYCISSCGMILLNKIALSTYNFNAGISLMFYQNLISCLVVAVLGLSGVVSVEKLSWKLIRVWIPVNIIFVGMLVSGMYSLKYINIAMVTILKNVTNIITAIGEVYIFRKRQNQKVWTAMFFMIISAISGGITDLSFDSMGYTWQIMNCILTASYSLTLRKVMDKAKQLTRTGSLNEISMVLLNNLLSLPFGIILILLFNEWEYVITTDVIKLPMFWVVATASGLLGLAISFTSMWFLYQTGPTTYSLVGSLNKIPISFAGLVLFKVPLSLPNLFSILFGLFAGIFFARAKMSRS